MKHQLATRGAFFDLDGVLVNTESLKSQAHLETALHFGGELPSSFYGDVMGEGGDTVASKAIEQAAIAVDVASYNACFAKIYEDMLGANIAAANGARTLLEALRARGFRCALVTGSPRAFVDRILALVRLTEYFDYVVTAERVARPKPAPDAYQHAMQAVAVAPSRGIAFEDSQSGLRAAQAAGLTAIAISHALNRTQDLSSAAVTLLGLEDVAKIMELVEELTSGSSGEA